MLSDDQINQFRIFGFLVLRKLFSDEETETMQTEFEHGRIATLKSNPNAGSLSLTQWSNLKPESPFIASLLEEKRFLDAADQLLGGNAVAVYTNSNRRGGDTRWHPDTRDLNVKGFKFTSYLRPVADNTGALRVSPGSHKGPFHQGLNESLEGFVLDLCDVPAHACEVEPGDVIVFDMNLYHAASDNSDDRRQLTFCYLSPPATSGEKKSILKLCGEMRETHQYTGAPPPHYHPDWLANPQENDRRREWIERLQEWGMID